MKAYQFVYTDRFQKHYTALSIRERDLVKRKLELLSTNPSHPSLRTKRIKGTDMLFECSVNMDIRVIWYYEGKSIIILAYIGRHDILKQF